jgi:hypothetical protein
MLNRFRLPHRLAASGWATIVTVVLLGALVLAPSAAAAGAYADQQGDSAAAGDITGIAVEGDKASGQIVFRIKGTNLATSIVNTLWLSIDSDANPLTGDLSDHGTDYWFGLDDDSYGFQRWDGSDWVDTSYSTVHINGSSSEIDISVNKSELGNASTINFVASTHFIGNVARDFAPNDGVFNYSLDANGPEIDGVDVKTTPSNGPRAGKSFVVAPVGLKLPPDGRANPTPLLPESYSCTAKLGAKRLAGKGTGGCTFAIPKQKARGKRLTVLLTVSYEGATKIVPLTFKVA